MSTGNFGERLREEVPYSLMHVPVQEMREGQAVSQCFLVKQKTQRVTRGGDPYLEIVLADRTGTLAARAWADATQRYATQFEQGDFVFVEGRTETYRNALQLIVQSIRRLENHEKETGKISEFDPALLVPTSDNNIEAMWKKLCAFAGSLSPTPLKTLTLELLESNAEAFKAYPAAIQYHHAYLGGLLEHTLEVATGVAQFTAAQSGIDRSLAVAGAILHDIGKLLELEHPIAPHHTLRGQLIGHLLLGRDMVREKAGALSWPDERLPELLAHIIVSHHGELEFGAAIVPKTAEAITVYHFDNLSAKLNMIRRHIEIDRESGDFTDWHTVLARKFFKGKLQDTSAEVIEEGDR